jgi:hypothetical protein
MLFVGGTKEPDQTVLLTWGTAANSCGLSLAEKERVDSTREVALGRRIHCLDGLALALDAVDGVGGGDVEVRVPRFTLALGPHERERR